MTTVKVQSHVGADRQLKIVLPGEFTDCDVDVIVAKRNGVSPSAKSASEKAADEPLWKGNPPRNNLGQTWKEFIDETAGSWEGEFPPREQGEYEVREEL